MVKGTGLVGRVFKQYETADEFLIFASGVSDSKSCTPSDLQREHDLLLESITNNPSKKTVYFSTSSVEDPDLKETPYIRHKLKMEALVRAHAPAFHIFRLSQLAGANGNPATILNYLYAKIVGGHAFELWKYSERNIIDAEDVYRIADHILKNELFTNQVINIANDKNYPVPYLVACIEAHTGKKAIFSEKERGQPFRIDISETLPICRQLKIGFGENYLPQLLEKYYPKK
ncbi:MAG TPA: NAD-dependent epimerase/dehydratase family protein [Puia sp.]|nr:NAD-dependent epimerase/dehydratase family protein [Puia sp.]